MLTAEGKVRAVLVQSYRRMAAMFRRVGWHVPPPPAVSGTGPELARRAARVQKGIDDALRELYPSAGGCG